MSLKTLSFMAILKNIKKTYILERNPSKTTKKRKSFQRK